MWEAKILTRLLTLARLLTQPHPLRPPPHHRGRCTLLFTDGFTSLEELRAWAAVLGRRPVGHTAHWRVCGGVEEAIGGGSEEPRTGTRSGQRPGPGQGQWWCWRVMTPPAGSPSASVSWRRRSGS
ncbi:hypothetical protein BDA96_05G119700 [Sorghum bicolor]|uniref:Uncharacterized protein n=1 Tax=Sorghum bicolor TaxID=4558 RepID=A0A921UGH4_SORBI|nr:hypothetical protein BDA96_05G119700 [Sorghum bicolor]